jgi:hypothetical protein
MLSASELNLPQAHQEIAVYAERVQRMFGMSPIYYTKRKEAKPI